MLTRNFVNNSLSNIKTVRGGIVYKTPAELAIAQFGGVSKLARAVKRSKASVSKWKTYVNQDGQRGLIPSCALARILQVSKKREYKINAEDLILGREE